jgi:uncharacterized membrane protein
MNARKIGNIAAWTALALSIPVAAFDGVMVLGGVFSMSNADCAVPDNWIWLAAGPFSFLPALTLGFISALIFRFHRDWTRHIVWLPIIWLFGGSLLFTWIQLWGNGFARELKPMFYISWVSLPMCIAAFCLWLVRMRIIADECHSDEGSSHHGFA